jgi:formylglycine-generating enzyme required for sulfatase activity
MRARTRGLSALLARIQCCNISRCRTHSPTAGTLITGQPHLATIMDTIAELLRDIFPDEYHRFVALLRRHRLALLIALTVIVSTIGYSFVYSRWPNPVRGTRHVLLYTPTPIWMGFLCSLWLLALTYVVIQLARTRAPLEADTSTVQIPHAPDEERSATDLSPTAIRLPQLLGGMELLRVAAGEFTMGGRSGHTVLLAAYHIGKVPITNAQYKRFVDATGHPSPSHWTGREVPAWKEDHPVVQVSWHDARAYCAWLSDETRVQFRLPTEAEWEKAAQGPDYRTFPWGETWESSICNNAERKLDDTEPVGAHSPEADSPYGVADMAGNVWEWTNSLNKDLPYDAHDGREDPKGQGERILRGGSFRCQVGQLTCAYRSVHNRTNAKGDEIGFRVAVSRAASNS